MSNITKVHFAEPFRESVGESTADRFKNVSLVVISQCSCDFIVRHVRAISVLAPECGKGWRILESEEALLSVLPGHHVAVFVLLQNAQSELPELCTGGYVCGEEMVGRRKKGEDKVTLVWYT